MTTLFINGKFTAQPVTGVQRFATEILLAADRLLAERNAGSRWTLLTPPQGSALPLRCVKQRVVGAPAAPLHVWEQWTLPRLAPVGLLLNLAGSCPLWRGGQACVLHDAAVFDQPQAYSAAFVAWYRFNFRVQARRARLLMTVSAFSRERLARHLGLAPTRLALLPEGADHLSALRADEALLDALGLRGRPFVLAVASANPTKNLPSLAAAFAPIGAEGSVRLVLVGRQRPGVFAAGGSAPGMPGVIHAGAVSDAQLKALYRHAVALVVPSRYEGFGLPPLEAMAEGCPVIAARAGALPEVCGDAPQWVPVDDVAALEQALRLLLNDPALRAARARAGREHVAAWSWRAAAGRLIELMGGAA